ncbi:hypothetical protein [Ekhidna sp.]|uniref:hypothetical protein n=1 Tax=Ekhidna sp. TaxID=2608089 RepID=UPI003BABDC02
MDIKSQIRKLKLTGTLYLWTYTENDRNYSGWNLSTTPESLSDLHELLNLMEQCQWSTTKTIRVQPPTPTQLNTVNNRNGKANWKSTSELILKANKNVDADSWNYRIGTNNLELTFGTKKLVELRNSLNKISKGNGDFAITDELDENILYFWPNNQQTGA